MYSVHPDVLTPGDDVVIWRYMSVDKYLSLIDTSRLYLCRLDKFEDPWEGTWPEGQHEYVNEEHEKISYIQRGFKYVNCWHANEFESAAMWDLYGSRQSGMAVKSTVGALKRAMIGIKEMYVGQVNYIDYSLPGLGLSFNGFVPALLKRKSFEHENEIRILAMDLESAVWRSTGEQSGFLEPTLTHMHCEVDLSILIGEVLFSPAMPDWLANTITNVSRKYGLNLKYTKSSLYDRRVR